jgi:DNA polymerase V
MRSTTPGLAVALTGSFPSPAQDYYDGPLSLDRVLLARPASTFLLRVAGAGLASVGIVDGDELVVDRSLDLRIGLVAVVVVDGEHRVGRLVLVEADGGQRVGLATDDHVLTLPAGASSWGVVTAAIHHLRTAGPGPVVGRR